VGARVLFGGTSKQSTRPAVRPTSLWSQPLKFLPIRIERRLRDGIYEQIREVMPLQSNLSIERMCELARQEVAAV
jgi:hypothetical protein